MKINNRNEISSYSIYININKYIYYILHQDKGFIIIVCNFKNKNRDTDYLLFYENQIEGDIKKMVVIYGIVP